jgi:hypothetical protein
VKDPGHLPHSSAEGENRHQGLDEIGGGLRAAGRRSSAAVPAAAKAMLAAEFIVRGAAAMNDPGSS